MSDYSFTVNKKEIEKSALDRHAMHKHHKFNFDDVQIISRCNHEWKLSFKEELYIKTTKSCVNIRSTESRNVSNIYSTLFKRIS